MINAQTLLPAKNASDVPVDMQFKLTFSRTPYLQSSGKVSLYTSGGQLVSTIDLAQMPYGVPTTGSWPWQEKLNGYQINVMRAAVDGNTAIFTFPIGTMNYGGSYYVTVDQSVFSNASSLGFGGISAGSWAFKVKEKPSADLDYTVAADGSGDFATLQGALDFIPANNTSPARIFMKNGLYYGLAFTKSKHNITIEGESASGVQIKGFNNNAMNSSTHWRSVVNLQGDNLKLISLTMVNTTPNGGTQAEALKLKGDKCVVVNCNFYSYQDTVLIEGRVYFYECMLEGDVDFIWGRGTVYFQTCELRANDAGYNVMARNHDTAHGYCFADCKLTATPGATSQYLGRDANTDYPYAEIVYLECTLSSVYQESGWKIRDEMNGTGLFFAEYKNVNEQGNLINTSKRHYLSKQLSSAQASLYRDLNWFFNGWVPVVPEYGRDCNGVSGGSAYYDDCGVCVGGNTGVQACSSFGQMEDACSFDGTVDANNAGYTGSGFVNMANETGATIQFYLVSSQTGKYTFDIRYANGSGTDRPMTLTYGSVSQTLDFAPTASWVDWGLQTVTLDLTETVSSVSLSAQNADGGPNFDVLIFEDEALSLGSCTKDCSGIMGGTAYVDDCGSCVGGDTGLEACVQDCNGDWGGTAVIDDCGICAGGNTGLTLCSGSGEAENACSADGVIETEHKGFSGSGYLNLENTATSAMSFIINAESAGTYTISMTFANGSDAARPMTLTGGSNNTVVDFVASGGWATWITEPVSVVLEKGPNELTLTSNTSAGSPNIDLIAFYDDEIAMGACGADCNGVVGGTAFIDGCEICVGGNTGLEACVKDCNGVLGGSAYVDNCGDCVGGNTGITECAPQLVQLVKGWNLIGCPIEGGADVEQALSSIISNVVVVKDFTGFYDPSSTEQSTLKELSWGKGFLIKVNADCELSW